MARKKFSKKQIKKKEIDFFSIEKKWQKEWERGKIFQVKSRLSAQGKRSTKAKSGKSKKCYVLEMFPYPSGSGLHMGHAFNYTIGDIYARFKRMNGFNVLYPMGFDALGLPAENAAIKAGEHPKKYTKKSIENFIKQQKSLGLSYDWSRKIETSDPEYYKWDQWIFLKMFEKGLAYRKKAPVNFCRKCNTVLANEQVHNGKCWRHEDTGVEIKHLEQWFFKITDYAKELYDKVEDLKDWPDRIKAMQKNWIGKSRGIDIDFMVDGKKWPIFTTRPDTIFGVTFMVVSAQHPRLMELVTDKQRKYVKKFLKKVKSVSEKELEELEKEGAFTGSYAVNPANGDKIPVWVGNFVLADYGSGMVMAVPAHDQRDFEFAKKYDIPIKVVINPDTYELNPEKMTRAFTEEGRMINSDKFDGVSSREAIKLISDWLEKKNLGKRTIQYKLRDWLISRQRYWGTPIPVVYCDKCGIVAVPEKDLPVVLPEKVKFGKGNPLGTNKNFVNIKCPKCKGKAKRETDTMDTFVNSSWYFLRYCDPKNKKEIFDKKKVDYWVPVDYYIGGAEHACMHLIYFRFYTKFLRNIGLLKIDEPVINLFNQGMLHGSGGYVMSKSRGNVVNPLDVLKKYGADVLRFYLISSASPDKDFDWSDKAIQGSFKFVNQIIEYFSKVKIGKSSAKIESKLNKGIKDVAEDIENFRYNLAVIKIRELFEKLENTESKDTLEKFLKLLSPFCPHITEELWHKLGNRNFISLEKWPVADEKKIDEKLEKQEQMIENTIDDIRNIFKIISERHPTHPPKKVYLYVIPKELRIYEEGKETIKGGLNADIEIFSVNDKKKYDPEGKSKKARPGKPGIFVE